MESGCVRRDSVGVRWWVYVVTSTLLFAACGASDDQEHGPTTDVVGGGDEDPQEDVGQQSTHVVVLPLEDTSQCPAGGVVVHTYLDRNGDGQVTEADIIDSTVVCHGEPGRRGDQGERGPAGEQGEPGATTNVVFAAVPVEAGADCPSGGTELRWGVDSNDNEVLDPEEVQGSTLICNGDGDGQGCQLVPYGQCAGASLDALDLRNVVMTGILLQDASLVGAKLQGTSLVAAQMQRADLSGVFLDTGTRLNNADLSGAVLVGATGSWGGAVPRSGEGLDIFADNEGAVLVAADFSGFRGELVFVASDLTDAVLRDVELSALFVEGGAAAGLDLGGAQIDFFVAKDVGFRGASFRGVVLGSEGGSVVARNLDLREVDFTDADLRGWVCGNCDWEDAVWSNTWCPTGVNSEENGGTCVGALATCDPRVNTDCAGVDLSGRDFSFDSFDMDSVLLVEDLRLQSAVLDDATFSGQFFGRVNADGASFQRADLREARCSESTFDDANFTGANLTAMNPLDCTFENVVWDDAICFNGGPAALSGGVCATCSLFYRRNCDDLVAPGSQMTSADSSTIFMWPLESARGADLRGSLFEWASFYGLEDMEGALLDEASFERVWFGEEFTSFRGASFRDARFVDVQCSVCDFRDADFTGADLSLGSDSLRCVTECQWLGATCPDGRVVTDERDTCVPGPCTADSLPSSELCEGTLLHGRTYQDGAVSSLVFEDADLRDVTFERMVLRGVHFRRSSLDNVHFVDGSCAETFSGDGCRFENTTMQGVTFENWTCEQAALPFGDSKGCVFEEVDLSEVDLSGLNCGFLDGGCSFPGSTCPPGPNPCTRLVGD